MVYRDAEIVHGGTGEFVTLRTYVSLLEAEFDRAALEAAGLDVRLFDAGTAAIIPHGGTALGVRLQVRESEVEHARALLDRPDPLDESERAEHPELRKPKGDAKWRKQMAADDDARRAFRAAVIGFFMCPVVGQLYAAWLILGVLPRRAELTKSGWRNLAGASIVVALVAVVCVLAFFRTK